jgi:23S rRNA (cytidine1920-2'-O)/16S rRNA (cytidine1409-2'-O)-methyltransferase
VRAGAIVTVDRGRRFVSRGGEKLDHALEAFGIDATGRGALDIGASTGGFTDALLQRGAASVVAVDVGYGQLDWRLRTDPRVRVMERTNFRLLADDAFPDGFDLIVCDASFIAVRTIVARAVAYLRPGGDMLLLVKPQFEAGPERVESGGVVRDPEVHRAILREVRQAMISLDLVPVGLVASPLLGPAGNREFLLRVRRDGAVLELEQIDAAVGA